MTEWLAQSPSASEEVSQGLKLGSLLIQRSCLQDNKWNQS